MTRTRGSDKASHTIEIELAQDKTALRSRKGDTGSVLWRASVAFAQVILQQYHFPPDRPLLNSDILKNSHILELGDGLAQHCAICTCEKLHHHRHRASSPTYEKTSFSTSMIKRTMGNLEGSPGSNICVEELDWEVLLSLPPDRRSRYYPRPTEQNPEWELVPVVDRIYHPSLLPALVETIEAVSTAGKTWVLVIVELRQDVVREFLEKWIHKGTWRLFRVDGVLELP